MDVLVHGAAHVHQEQDLDLCCGRARGRISGCPATGVGGGAVDGAVEVQLQLGAPRANGQAAQRDLDVAGA